MFSFLCFQTCLIYQHKFYIYDLMLASLIFQYLLQHLVILHNLYLGLAAILIRGIDGLKFSLFLQQSIAYYALLFLMNTSFCKVVSYNDYRWNLCLLISS